MERAFDSSCRAGLIAKFILSAAPPHPTSEFIKRRHPSLQGENLSRLTGAE
jgi:hypothetical protein